MTGTSYMQEPIRGGTIEHNWELHHELKPNEVFVEVGGFWGRYGVRAARQGAKVFLVEPSPLNATTLEQLNHEEHIDDKVEVVRKAVCDRHGKVPFIQVDNPAGYRLASDPSEEEEFASSIVEVEGDTLEGILDGLRVDHVDLLSCDCENHEVDLVKYGGRWFKEHLVKNVAIGAYHSPENPGVVMEILKGYGYVDLVYEESIVFGRAP